MKKTGMTKNRKPLAILTAGIITAVGFATYSFVTPDVATAENQLLKNGGVKVVKKDNKALLLDRIKALPMMKQAKLNPYKVTETNGVYYVMFSTPQGQSASVFLSKDLKLMIHSGQGISTETGVPYAPPVDVTTFENKQSFTYGNGPKTIYVFTDPECPYCKKFEKKWESLKDKYTMKVFMLPLSFHKEAPEMTHWLLSAKTDEEKGQRLLAISNGSTEYKDFMKTETVEQYKKIEAKVKEIANIAKTNSITGTPTVLGKNGKPLNWTKL